MNKELKKCISQEEQKAILIDLIVEFDSFCRKNDLKYYLIAGTLLGAVRHSGFIPWDDDVDVCMFRKDYDRLMEIYSGSSPKYKLLSLNKDRDYYYPFAKLVNDDTVLIESKNAPRNLGLYLDIFPFDNCPGRTLQEACRSIDKTKFLRDLRNLKMVDFSKDRRLYKNIILLAGKIFSFPLSCRRISQLLSDKACKNKDTDCRYVGELVNTAYGHGEVFDKKYFGNGVKIKFEGHEFLAPENYDAVLKSMYGNYMELPPIEKRKSHHGFVCWYK